MLQGTRLWDYIQSISAYVTPPWVVVFILGMFWKRATEQVCKNKNTKKNIKDDMATLTLNQSDPHLNITNFLLHQLQPEADVIQYM